MAPVLAVQPEAWSQFHKEEAIVQFLAVSGVAFAVIYRSSLVALTAYSLATTVGILTTTKM